MLLVIYIYSCHVALVFWPGQLSGLHKPLAQSQLQLQLYEQELNLGPVNYKSTVLPTM